MAAESPSEMVNGGAGVAWKHMAKQGKQGNVRSCSAVGVAPSQTKQRERAGSPRAGKLGVALWEPEAHNRNPVAADVTKAVGKAMSDLLPSMLLKMTPKRGHHDADVRVGAPDRDSNGG